MQIKTLEEILKPFEFTPKRYIGGGVNGKSYDLLPNVKQTITQDVYEAILNSEFREELENVN